MKSRRRASPLRRNKPVHGFGILLALTVAPLLPAVAAPPVVYHSPDDDGLPPGAPVEIPANAAFTVHLYVDGGTNASTEIPCAQGTGDDVCGLQLALEGQDGMALSSFDSPSHIVYYLSGASLQLAGGDPWRGSLGPWKIGDLVVQGADGATLQLLSSKSLNASLGPEAIAPTTILTALPEPSSTLALLCGGALLAVLARRRDRKHSARPIAHQKRIGRSIVSAIAVALLTSPILLGSPASAQVSTDCGDVDSNGTIDIVDLDTILQFLVGDPAAPDLQNTPALLVRADVDGNGLVELEDWARIRRYMLDLTGGMNETCPLSGTAYAPAVLPPPAVDQASTIDTDDASVILTGTADPNDVIRVNAPLGRPSTAADLDGVWSVGVPLVFGQPNLLEIFRDHGAGHFSEKVLLTANQNAPTGTARVEGRVVNALDGKPLAGASVELEGTTYPTDSLGEFEIRDLPRGLVVLLAEHSGFVPRIVLAGAGIRSVPQAGALPAFDPLVIELTPRAAPVTIGSAGGSLTSPRGVELVIPPGSLSGATEITLTDLGSVSGLPFGPVALVDVGPDAITFDPPATLRFFTNLEPGTPIDFEQVDHVTKAVVPLVGVVSADGFIEVPIASTSGSPLRRLVHGYLVESRAPEDVSGEEIGITAECDQDLKNESHFFEPKVLRFELSDQGLRNIVADPSLLWQLDPEKLLYGLRKYVRPLIVIPDLPAGHLGQARVSYRKVFKRVKVYVGTYPEKIGPIEYTELGFMEYEVVLTDPFPVLNSFKDVGKNFACCVSGSSSNFAQSTLVAGDESSCPTSADWGDPHLIRFDHVGEAISQSRGEGRYNFQASGEFVLFESTEDDMVVQVRLLPSNGSTSVTKAAAMDVDGDRVTIYSNAVLDVRIEGMPTPLTVGAPHPLSGGGELERGTTSAGKDVVFVRWADGSEVRVSEWTTAAAGSYLNLFPTLPSSRFGRVQGLLGNANGILVDDFNFRDGTPADPAEIHTTYADSWRISQAESLFDYEMGEDTSTYNGTPADPDYTVEDLDPAAVAAATVSCNAAGIFGEPWLSDCIVDTVVFGDPAVAGQANDAQSEVPDSGIYVAVPGQANIFGAGLASVPDFGGPGGNGILPTEVALPVGTGRTLRVLDAAGTISFYPTSSIPPDGLDSSIAEWGEWGGLTGPFASRTGIAMGVFLEDTSPPAAPPPPYTCAEATSEFVAPEVGQIFCLGDGRTKFGEPQFVLVPDDATRLFLGYADGNVPLTLIDFESGYADRDPVTSIPMATNQVSVTTIGPTEVAGVGPNPTSAFSPQDTPAGGMPGAFFLTDRAGQVPPTPTSGDAYGLVFASPVSQVSLDLYDFVFQAGDIPVGATATLSAYSDAGMSSLLGSSAFTIPSSNLWDGFVTTLQVRSDSGILAVQLTFDANDWGTGIDNIEVLALPPATPPPPGYYDDNGGMHEFILEFSQ